MPINPNIPLGVQGSKFGELISKGFQQYQQAQHTKRVDEQNNALLLLKQEQAAQKNKDIERKSIQRQFASTAVSQLLPAYENGDFGTVEKIMTDEITRLGVDNKESIPMEDALTAHKQDPQRAFNAIKQIVSQARMEKLIPQQEKGKRVNAQIPGQSGIVPAIETPQGFLTDPKTGARLPDAIKAPSRQETGGAGSLTGSQEGKLISGSIESEQAISNTILSMESIKELVKSPDFMGGVSGDINSLINSGLQQIKQITKTEDIFIRNPDGKVTLDESKLGDLGVKNMGRFRRAAINDDRVDSAVLDLAYTLAQVRDPGGRLSDKDVEAAEKTIRSGADRVSILKLLEDTQKRAIQKFNSDTRILNKRTGGNIPQISIEEILGNKRVDTEDEVADRILKKMGL